MPPRHRPRLPWTEPKDADRTTRPSEHAQAPAPLFGCRMLISRHGHLSLKLDPSQGGGWEDKGVVDPPLTPSPYKKARPAQPIIIAASKPCRQLQDHLRPNQSWTPVSGHDDTLPPRRPHRTQMSSPISSSGGTPRRSKPRLGSTRFRHSHSHIFLHHTSGG